MSTSNRFVSKSVPPFYFNFHAQPYGEDSMDKKYQAHTTIVGRTGAGKTVAVSEFFKPRLPSDSVESGDEYSKLRISDEEFEQIIRRADEVGESEERGNK
jgi:hypothetical protein